MTCERTKRVKFEYFLLKFLYPFQPPKCKQNRYFLEKLKGAILWLVEISKLLPCGFQRL